VGEARTGEEGNNVGNPCLPGLAGIELGPIHIGKVSPIVLSGLCSDTLPIHIEGVSGRHWYRILYPTRTRASG
jgi:hypothetical protein